MDSTYHEISVYLDFPTAHWSRIKCTNSLERLNEELRLEGEMHPDIP
ncbi:MAG: transposase [Candidatus Cloacimonetes bacterium]|nr:transposase [Candidatus Cloacimonadota bacterium]